MHCNTDKLNTEIDAHLFHANYICLYFLFQEGEHSSVQDAQATMRLYTMHKKQWEMEITQKKMQKANFNQSKKSSKKVSKPLKKDSKNSRSTYQDSDSE